MGLALIEFQTQFSLSFIVCMKVQQKFLELIDCFINKRCINAVYEKEEAQLFSTISFQVINSSLYPQIAIRKVFQIFNIHDILYSYYSNWLMNRLHPLKNSIGKHNTHNSQLYEKLLEDDHFLSQGDESGLHGAHENEHEQLQQVEMIIEFGENSKASLMVGPHEDSLTLAKRFCFRNNIDPRIITTLAANIRNLQATTFHRQAPIRIDRNQMNFDDKQNRNDNRMRSRSNEKKHDTSKSRLNRTKTGQSSHNDSIMSTSKSGIPNGSFSNRYNVFQRLYQDSRKKNVGKVDTNQSRRNQSRVSINQSNTINRSLNQSSINSCLNVYQKNTKLKEESRRRNQQLLEMKKQKQTESCKFKPDINPLSEMIASKLRELDESGICSRNGEKQMMKVKEYLLKKEAEQMRECTFKPKIITKISAQNNQYSTQRFLQLHDDHKIRDLKKKQQSTQKIKEQQRQNHPVINKLSEAIVTKDFFERLEQDKAKRVIKKQSLQKLKEQKSDKRPSTGRAPFNRNLGQKTIGQYLYEKSKDSRALTVKKPPKILTDPKSSQIYQQCKRFAFEYLFEMLDSDHDGFISSTKIHIRGLGQQVLKLLAPLLSEMEEFQVLLNQQEFMEAVERLYNTMSIDEKNIILKFYKNREGSKYEEMHSFCPTLNEKSLLIARDLCSNDGDIYENSIVRLKQKQNRLNRLRAERMLQEYNECTFHPQLRG